MKLGETAVSHLAIYGYITHNGLLSFSTDPNKPEQVDFLLVKFIHNDSVSRRLLLFLDRYLWKSSKIRIHDNDTFRQGV